MNQGAAYLGGACQGLKQGPPYLEPQESRVSSREGPCSLSTQPLGWGGGQALLPAEPGPAQPPLPFWEQRINSDRVPHRAPREDERALLCRVEHGATTLRGKTGPTKGTGDPSWSSSAPGLDRGPQESVSGADTVSGATWMSHRTLYPRPRVSLSLQCQDLGLGEWVQRERDPKPRALCQDWGLLTGGAPNWDGQYPVSTTSALGISGAPGAGWRRRGRTPSH